MPDHARLRALTGGVGTYSVALAEVSKAEIAALIEDVDALRVRIAETGAEAAHLREALVTAHDAEHGLEKRIADALAILERVDSAGVGLVARAINKLKGRDDDEEDEAAA